MQKQKVALVTGAAQGIGEAIACTLASHGLLPVIADIDRIKADTVAERIRQDGGRALSVFMDVADTASIKKALHEVIAQVETVDILVNNAGILHTTPILKITEEEWDRILAVNLKGAFFVIQAVLPFMQQQKWGRIINISSVAGRMGGYGNGVAYAATKAGLIGLTMALSRRLASFGITVNAVAPGTTRTAIVDQLSVQQIESLKQMIPMNTLGKPEDIGEAVAFFASEKAGYITGAVLDINGGLFTG